MSTKYRARASVDSVLGHFPSESQRQRFYELVALQAAGEIRELRKEPIYVLSHFPRCVFTPDADYLERVGDGWVRCVEDVKPQGGEQARDVFVRICWLLAARPEVSCVRLLRRAGPRARAPRGWRLVNGWVTREYRREPMRRRAA